MTNKVLKREQRKVNKIIREANKTWFDEHLVGKYKIKQIGRRVYKDLGTYYLFEIKHSYLFKGEICVNKEILDWFRFESIFFINKLLNCVNNFVIKEIRVKMFTFDEELKK